jgi:hypothetical protein
MDDKKGKLIAIVKSASLPPEVENLLLAEIEKQDEITDEFIGKVADTLDRIGVYFKTAGEVQNEYLDALLREAEKAGKAFDVLKALGEAPVQSE